MTKVSAGFTRMATLISAAGPSDEVVGGPGCRAGSVLFVSYVVFAGAGWGLVQGSLRVKRELGEGVHFTLHPGISPGRVGGT